MWCHKLLLCKTNSNFFNLLAVTELRVVAVEQVMILVKINCYQGMSQVKLNCSKHLGTLKLELEKLNRRHSRHTRKRSTL